jgi:hypothetical protein
MKSDTVPVEKESEHASAFQQFIDSIRDDLLNLICLCSFYSRIYDTVSYQLESNQMNQIRHEVGDGLHLSLSQQL